MPVIGYLVRPALAKAVVNANDDVLVQFFDGEVARTVFVNDGAAGDPIPGAERASFTRRFWRREFAQDAVDDLGLRLLEQVRRRLEYFVDAKVQIVGFELASSFPLMWKSDGLSLGRLA